jgi:hypothetical protein
MTSLQEPVSHHKTTRSRSNMIKKAIQISLLLFLILSSVYSSLGYFNLMLNTESYDKSIRQFEERIKTISNLIPFSHGNIGYFSDEPTDENFINETTEYVLTQYALSPIIINKDIYHEWNILNMSHESFDAWNKAYGNQYKLIASGNGFYLVKRLP